VIALDAETGKERWAWGAKVDRTRRVAFATSRGVSTWLDVEARTDPTCRRPIFLGTIDARLVALDAATGAPCADFGRSGQVDLTEGIAVIDRCCYQVTSPPVVVNGLVVVGSAIGDNRAADPSSAASFARTTRAAARSAGVGIRSRRASRIRCARRGPATAGAARARRTCGP